MLKPREKTSRKKYIIKISGATDFYGSLDSNQDGKVHYNEVVDFFGIDTSDTGQLGPLKATIKEWDT